MYQLQLQYLYSLSNQVVELQPKFITEAPAWSLGHVKCNSVLLIKLILEFNESSEQYVR